MLNESIEILGSLGRRLKRRQLVFLEDSPDYCKASAITGHTGVLGRKCSPANPVGNGKQTQSEIKRCIKLCTDCGYKVRRSLMTAIYKILYNL